MLAARGPQSSRRNGRGRRLGPTQRLAAPDLPPNFLPSLPLTGQRGYETGGVLLAFADYCGAPGHRCNFSANPQCRYQVVQSLLVPSRSKSQKVSPGESTGALYDLSLATLLATTGGSSLARQYDSLPRAVMSEVPDHPWQPWRFHDRSTGYFQSIARLLNRPTATGPGSCPVATAALESWVEDLAQTLHVPPPFDYLKAAQLPPNVVRNMKDLGGLDLVLGNIHGKQPYPTSPQPASIPRPSPARSQRTQGRTRSWRPEDRREFLETQLRATSPSGTEESGYRFLTRQLVAVGGRQLLKQHRESVSSLLCSNFPELAWKRWRFVKTSHDWWQALGRLISASAQSPDCVAISVLQDYIDDLARELNVNKQEDWYSVTQEALQSHSHRLALFGGLPGLLQTALPLENWNMDHFGAHLKIQAQVQQTLDELLPNPAPFKSALPIPSSASGTHILDR